jgi:hypothetical protein
LFKKVTLITLLSPLVFGKVLRVQDEGASFSYHPYKEVCAFFGKKDVLLADKLDARTIDCMGHEFKIEKFCVEKYAKDTSYTRARFDIADKNVTCHKSKAVILSILCDEKHKEYCKEPRQGCLKLKKVFARNHELVRASLLESLPVQLKCYYSQKVELDLKDPLEN